MKHNLLAMLIILLTTARASAVEVTIVYNDNSAQGQEEGFNDPILGAARQTAFERAMEIWTTHLDGDIALEIDARFDPLASPTALGQASTASYSANQTGLGVLVWYSSALASQLHGSSLPSTSDTSFEGFHMSAQFNSDLDNNALGAGRWYYGLDGNPPGSDVDFVTVTLHELGHAFGFGPLVNFSTGAWGSPFPRISPISFPYS